jgi:hypothetical protein
MIRCYCGAEMVQRTTRYGVAYCCTAPNCDGIVGTHRRTGLPMGLPADKATRQARRQAHEAFDRLWVKARDKSGARKRAYKWLAEVMGLTEHTAHIGHMTKDQCERVVQLCEAKAPQPA